jgi:hypothetical protein
MGTFNRVHEFVTMAKFNRVCAERALNNQNNLALLNTHNEFNDMFNKIKEKEGTND